MNRKPQGAKYRNLHLRGATIYYQREIRGERVRFSRETSDWNEAAAIPDLYAEKKGVGLLPSVTWEVPFADFARRYLEEDTQHLAATTRSDRNFRLFTRRKPACMENRGSNPAQNHLPSAPSLHPPRVGRDLVVDTLDCVRASDRSVRRGRAPAAGPQGAFGTLNSLGGGAC